MDNAGTTDAWNVWTMTIVETGCAKGLCRLPRSPRLPNWVEGHFRACINSCAPCMPGIPEHCSGLDPSHEFICQAGKCRYCHRTTHAGCPEGQFCAHAETGCFDVCGPMADQAYLGGHRRAAPSVMPPSVLCPMVRPSECRYCYDSRRARNEVDAGCTRTIHDA